jgi:hypothetical protein
MEQRNGRIDRYGQTQPPTIAFTNPSTTCVRYNQPMHGGADHTATFLGLLEGCAIEHRLLFGNDLRTLAEAHGPINPLDIPAESDRAELRSAMKQAFDKLLRSSPAIDWDRIRTELKRIEERLDRQEKDSIDAKLQTRWLPLKENNPLFDFSRWAAYWSRRDLECVLGFFTEDALYVDATRNYHAQGKIGLRRLLSRIFHASNGTTVVNSAKFAPAETEVELEWVQIGSRIPGPDIHTSLGSGSVRGKSSLWVAAGRVFKCIDCPSEEDLKQIALDSLNFSRRAGAGHISETETEVFIDRIVLLKRLKLRIPPARQSDGKANES